MCQTNWINKTNWYHLLILQPQLKRVAICYPLFTLANLTLLWLYWPSCTNFLYLWIHMYKFYVTKLAIYYFIGLHAPILLGYQYVFYPNWTFQTMSIDLPYYPFSPLQILYGSGATLTTGFVFITGNVKSYFQPGYQLLLLFYLLSSLIIFLSL